MRVSARRDGVTGARVGRRVNQPATSTTRWAGAMVKRQNEPSAAGGTMARPATVSPVP